MKGMRGRLVDYRLVPTLFGVRVDVLVERRTMPVGDKERSWERLRKEDIGVFMRVVRAQGD